MLYIPFEHDFNLKYYSFIIALKVGVNSTRKRIQIIIKPTFTMITKIYIFDI